MPNWVENDMEISGPTDSVSRLLTLFVTKGAPDAHKLIPYPKEYQALDDQARAWEEERKAKGLDIYGPERPRDGYNSGGYEWCIQNWGTKWPCSQAGEMAERPSRTSTKRTVKLFFLTAWSPAEPVYAALAKQAPDCRIDVRYYEAGMGFCGRFSYRDGQQIRNEYNNQYRGRRGG